MPEDASRAQKRMQGLLRKALRIAEALPQADTIKETAAAYRSQHQDADRRFHVERYGKTRFWGLYEGDALLAVTVYRRAHTRCAIGSRHRKRVSNNSRGVNRERMRTQPRLMPLGGRWHGCLGSEGQGANGSESHDAPFVGLIQAYGAMRSALQRFSRDRFQRPLR